MDRRGSTIGMMVLLTVGLVLAGCGVPSSGPATDFNAPQTNPDGADGATGAVLEPSKDDAYESLTRFLSASAGEPGTRTDRLNRFFEKPITGAANEAAPLNIVKVVSREYVEPGEVHSTIRVTGEVVGVYNEDGQFQLLSGRRAWTMEFALSRQEDRRWLLVNPPSQLLLAQDTFESEYQSASLYFPAASGQGLVPDIRYVYRHQASDRQRTVLMEWLLAGPSEWLQQAVVTAFPRGTVLNNPPLTTKGTVVVDLSSEAVSAEPKMMAAQIVWTLWMVGQDNMLTVQINGQQAWSGSRTSLAAMNPAANQGAGALYYLSKGLITPEIPQYRTAELAKDVKYAAPLATSRRIALTHTNGTVTIIAETQPKDNPATAEAFQVTGLPEGGQTGRPAWVSGSILLVPKGGKLYVVNVDAKGHGKARHESIASGVGQVSVPPDGARIAMSVNGTAVVAPLNRVDEGVVEIGDQRRVGLDVHDVKDVGWSSVSRLIVLGSGPEEKLIWEMSIDNSYAKAQADLGRSLVPSEVAVYCDNPQDAYVTSRIYVAIINGQIYQVASDNLVTPSTMAEGTKGASAPFLA